MTVDEVLDILTDYKLARLYYEDQIKSNKSLLMSNGQSLSSVKNLGSKSWEDLPESLKEGVLECINAYYTQVTPNTSNSYGRGVIMTGFSSENDAREAYKMFRVDSASDTKGLTEENVRGDILDIAYKLCGKAYAQPEDSTGEYAQYAANDPVWCDGDLTGNYPSGLAGLNCSSFTSYIYRRAKAGFYNISKFKGNTSVFGTSGSYEINVNDRARDLSELSFEWTNTGSQLSKLPNADELKNLGSTLKGIKPGDRLYAKNHTGIYYGLIDGEPYTIEAANENLGIICRPLLTGEWTTWEPIELMILPGTEATAASNEAIYNLADNVKKPTKGFVTTDSDYENWELDDQPLVTSSLSSTDTSSTSSDSNPGSDLDSGLGKRGITGKPVRQLPDDRLAVSLLVSNNIVTDSFDVATYSANEPFSTETTVPKGEDKDTEDTASYIIKGHNYGILSLKNNSLIISNIPINGVTGNANLALIPPYGTSYEWKAILELNKNIYNIWKSEPVDVNGEMCDCFINFNEAVGTMISLHSGSEDTSVYNSNGDLVAGGGREITVEDDISIMNNLKNDSTINFFGSLFESFYGPYLAGIENNLWTYCPTLDRTSISNYICLFIMPIVTVLLLAIAIIILWLMAVFKRNQSVFVNGEFI